MSRKELSEVIEEIVEKDNRYEKAAYYFVRKALDYTLKEIRSQETPRDSNHVSGPELLDGIRDYALTQYGPMTLTLFNHWGIRDCASFGDIVFNLVDQGVFGKTDRDRPEDFSGGYDFREAFTVPFLPPSARPETADSESDSTRCETDRAD